MNTVRAVLPFRIWFRSTALCSRAALLFALFTGYPLVAYWLYLQQYRDPGGYSGLDPAALMHDVKWLDWPFVAYFGAACLVGLWLVVSPRVTRGQCVTVGGVALVTGLSIAIWLETQLNPKTTNLFESVFGIGGSEEFAKLVPVAAALVIAASTPARLQQWFALNPRSYLYLGCLSGVVFGCAEGVEYIVNMQSADVNGQSSVFAMTATVFLRLITDPINHALWAGITGYFLGLAVVRARAANRCGLSGLLPQSWLIGIGLLIASTLHGVNDFAAAHPLVQALVDVLSAVMLLGYAVAGDVVEQAIAAAPAPRWGRRFVQACQPRPRQPPAPQHWAPQPQWTAPAQWTAPPPR
jgi:RsiW-degrading membrane proteinase PrsW (M82 family)